MVVSPDYCSFIKNKIAKRKGGWNISASIDSMGVVGDLWVM